MGKGNFALFSEEQRQAYKDVLDTLTERNKAVLSTLIAAPDGLAVFEIAERLGTEPHCISGRITELKKRKCVEKSGRKRRNPKTGKPWSVLVYADWRNPDV